MNLSELEGCVLGVIGRTPAITPYAIRKHFRASVTTHWRASTGAIYPVADKLAALGLVSREKINDTARGGYRLSLTAAGQAALRAWVCAPAGELAEPQADPIRTRVHFLASIPRADRAGLVSDWVAETDLQIAQALTNPSVDEWEERATRGIVQQLRARKTWLIELKEQMADDTGP